MASGNALDRNIAIKTQLEALDQITFENLQNISKYRYVTGLTRSTGWQNILWGGITLWLGLSGLEYAVGHLVQAILGVLILGVSLWSIARPLLQNVRAFAGIFLICGVWNLLLVILDNFQGLAFLVALLGLAQLWWAYRYEKDYRTYRHNIAKPASADSAMYDQIWEAIRQTKPQTDSNFIEFQIGSTRLRGWLLNNLAVIGVKNKKYLHLCREDQFSFQPHVAKIGKKKRFYTGVKLNEISAQGFIKRPSFDHYAAWKAQQNPTISPEALQLTGSGKTHWLPFGYLHPAIRIPILLACAVLIFYTIVMILFFIQYG